MKGPILITGTQRSGTTITEQVLNSHPRGYITHELDLIHVLNALNSATFHPRHKTRKVLQYGGDFQKILTQLYQGSTDKKLDFYGDKLPEYIQNAETLLRYLPASKFIFCSRNPLEVISSMKRRNQDAIAGIDRGWKPLKLTEMCNRWKNAHLDVLHIQKPHQK